MAGFERGDEGYRPAVGRDHLGYHLQHSLYQTHPDPGGQLSAQRAHKQVRETNPPNSSNAKHIYQLPKDLVFLLCK